MRSFGPSQGQSTQRTMPMIGGGGTEPMGRASPMRAQPAPQMEPRSAPLPGGMGGGGMAGRVAGMFGGGAPQPGGMASRVAGMMGGGGGAGGMAARIGGIMSDERSKTKIRELEGIKQRYLALLDDGQATADEGERLKSQFGSVGSHEFEYKPEFQDEPGAGRGRFAGPMTSELRGIPGVVKEGPGGMEQVDTPRLTMANASATGELSREVSDLRERLAALSDDPDATLDVAGGRRR